MFDENFARPTGADPLLPWLVPSYFGNWTTTNLTLKGTGDLGHFAYAMLTNDWSDYSVQTVIEFPIGAVGGGIGARLNPVSGAHYGVWLYPETSPSPGNALTLQLLKFDSWTSFSNLATVNLGPLGLGIGTNFHTLKLTCQGPQITVFYDSALPIDVTDTGAPHTNGGVTLLDLFGFEIR